MIVLTVVYPNSADAHFDMAYYTARHMPMVGALCKDFGVGTMRVLQGTSSMDGGEAGYAALTMIEFPSADDVHKALAAHGAQIVGDVPNFTNIQPTLQISDVAL
jgi:uncharacterized protein (TIGR02118 family)